MVGADQTMDSSFLDTADQLGSSLTPQKFGLASTQSRSGIGHGAKFSFFGGIKPQQCTEYMRSIIIDNIWMVLQDRILSGDDLFC